MDKYFYMVSQLPMLFFNRETTMTTDHFLSETEKWLSRRDYNRLSQTHIRDTKMNKQDSRLQREYKVFEYRLRHEIALWRKALRDNQDYKPSVFPMSMVREGNPLQVEINLLQLRWNFIDELEKEHHFDLEFLILYFLKLQILNRLDLFDKEEGLKRFKELVHIQSEDQETTRNEA